MNAIKFIKDHGVEKAREVVEGVPDGAEVYAYRSKTYFSSPNRIYDKKLSAWEEMDRGMDLDLYEDQIWLDDLKRLVESVDIIKELGGINRVKRTYESRPFELAYADLKQAIADYESIYSNDIKIEVSFGFTLMSPERLACIDMGDDSHIENHISPNCKQVK